MVSRLLVDHNGTLWVGTAEGLNRSTRRLHSLCVPLDAAARHADILELVEDADGALWVGTDNAGLHRFDPTNGKFTRQYRYDASRHDALSDNRVNSVHLNSSGTMWVGTQNGLCRFNRGTDTFNVYTRRHGLPGNAVACVLEDAHGELWMSTNNGVAAFNPLTNAVRRYSTADGLEGPNLTGWGACFQSPSGEMFFGGFSGGTAFHPDEVVDASDSPPLF